MRHRFEENINQNTQREENGLVKENKNDQDKEGKVEDEEERNGLKGTDWNEGQNKALQRYLTF